jgi:hypothetical protein
VIARLIPGQLQPENKKPMLLQELIKEYMLPVIPRTFRFEDALTKSNR